MGKIYIIAERIKTAGVFVALCFCTLCINAQQLAFPEAAGWGRYAQGARKSSSPTVYHVTNLNDSGTGSLRDAVSQSNRIVVFDVAGVINIKDRMVFSSNIYVAGQTAPGEGITVYGNGVSFSDASNIICRYMRFRMGHNGTSGKDCAGVASGSNMIFDHCSFSWGLDETFSINANDLSWEANITLMNCIIGQGLMVHSAGGLMQAKYITLYRNLYIDNSTRNNKVKGINQYANNVVYNWQDGCYIMGGDSQGESFCNIQSNLFINGPAKGGNGLGGGNANFHFYGNDNWQDKDMDGTLAPVCIDQTVTGGGDKQEVPYDYPQLTLYNGNELIEKNIPTVGASLPYRDPSDCYMIDELMSFGKKGALISNEENLSCGAPSTWNVYAGVKKTDSDGDGMPDEWEDNNGTDKSKADATTLADNGYLNIENYINSITVNDRDYFLRMPATFKLSNATTSTLTLSWADYTYGEQGFIVEYKKDGESDYKEVARLDAGATSCTIEGLQDASSYNVRVCAYDGSNKSEYNEIIAKTRPIDVALVDVDSYQADVTNTMDGIDDKKLLLNTDDVLSYSLTEVVKPSTVVATGKGQITITNLGDMTSAVKYSLLDGDAAYSPESASQYFTKASIATGANLKLDGTFTFTGAAGNGAVMTKIANQSGATLATTELLAANKVTFTLTPVEGRTFKPTKISFRAASSGSRCGAKLTATAQGDGAEVPLCTDATLTASSTGGTKDIYTASVDITDMSVSTSAPLTITFALKALTSTGYIGIDSLVIEGSIAGGVIAGTTSVNKAGEGTLVMKTKNTYTGATVLHDGVLEFNSIANGGAASSLGASVEYSQNWVMDGGTYRYTGANASTNRSAQLRRTTTLEIANEKKLAMSGTIEEYGNDDADLIIDGTGTLAVASTNFFGYKGRTILNGGNLYLSTVDVAKAGIGSSKQLVLAGGKLSTKGESSNYETYSFPIEVEEGTTSVFAPNRNCYVKNKITGAGTLQYDIPYVREYFDPNITEFTGKIIANGIYKESSEVGSEFISEGCFNMPTTRVELTGNAMMLMWKTEGNGYIGGLSGESTTALMASSKNTDGAQCHWTIGGSNSDEIFRGVINNNQSAKGHYGVNNITKVGTGYWLLTGKNTYSGTTTINGGEFIVNGTHSGAGAYIVNSDATLRGHGTINGGGAVTVNSGATLASGDTLAVADKTFTITSPVTMKSGSALSLDAINTAKYPYNQTSFSFTSLTIEDGVTLKIDRSSVENTLQADNCFTVFATVPATLNGTFSAISPTTPGDGLKWDTSELYTTGKLYIRSDIDGICQIENNELPMDEGYNIAGQRVNASAKGVIILNGKKTYR